MSDLFPEYKGNPPKAGFCEYLLHFRRIWKYFCIELFT